MVDVEIGRVDVVGVAAAAEQEGELAQHRGLGGGAVMRHVEVDERRLAAATAADAPWRARRFGQVEAAPGRGERQSGGQQHAVGDLAGELEHLRPGRGDVDRILLALREHHLGAAQLVQFAVLRDRIAGPQRAQRLDIFAHDADRLDRLDAGFGEIEDVADRHVQDRRGLARTRRAWRSTWRPAAAARDRD